MLGYVIGSVKIASMKDKLKLVIQGENDRFGNAAAVKDELTQHDVEGKVIEVTNADHSYRNSEKEPVFQEQAIQILLENI